MWRPESIPLSLISVTTTLLICASPALAQFRPATTRGAVSVLLPNFMAGVPKTMPASVVSVEPPARTAFAFDPRDVPDAGDFWKNATVTVDQNSTFIWHQERTARADFLSEDADGTTITRQSTIFERMTGTCFYTPSPVDQGRCLDFRQEKTTLITTSPLPRNATQTTNVGTVMITNSFDNGTFNLAHFEMVSVTITDGVAKLPTSSTGGAMPIRTQAPGLAAAALLVGGAAAML